MFDEIAHDDGYRPPGPKIKIAEVSVRGTLSPDEVSAYIHQYSSDGHRNVAMHKYTTAGNWTIYHVMAEDPSWRR